MIKVKDKGSFKYTVQFLKAMREKKMYKVLDRYGRMGVNALMQATPIDSGKTAASWHYHVEITDRSATIVWTNDNETDYGYPIILLIQYGHADKAGSWIQGRDIVNPAIEHTLNRIKNAVWREVCNS